MRESEFQRKVIKELKEKFKGCIIMKNDASYLQGIPDLIILYKNKWAALEVKRCSTASKRPNQDYYVEYLKQLSYASYIYPENKQEVFDELSRIFT